jgi:hypothetical protein
LKSNGEDAITHSPASQSMIGPQRRIGRALMRPPSKGAPAAPAEPAPRNRAAPAKPALEHVTT